MDELKETFSFTKETIKDLEKFKISQYIINHYDLNILSRFMVTTEDYCGKCPPVLLKKNISFKKKYLEYEAISTRHIDIFMLAFGQAIEQRILKDADVIRKDFGATNVRTTDLICSPEIYQKHRDRFKYTLPTLDYNIKDNEYIIHNEEWYIYIESEKIEVTETDTEIQIWGEMVIKIPIRIKIYDSSSH